MRVMWLAWIGASLAGLIALVAAIGAMLPRDHFATKKARFRASPEALYAVIAGPPDWRTGVKGFAVLPEKDGRKRWWEEDTHRQKITYELVEEHFPSHLAVRIDDQGKPFGGTWSFDITPSSDGGSELRITENGKVYNVIFRFMARFIFGYTRSIETYFSDLGTKFGQPVQIEA